MDVEGSAGRDSTWRRAAADDAGGGAGGGGGGAGMEAQVVPLELYDSARAKIDANLRWLFAKAYGIDHIPADLRDPFYTDQYEQEHIKPPILHLLLSGELYCRVCGLILHAEQAASLQSHQSVIQALSRKGIYVLQTDNTPVSDVDLSSAPIKMSSHIHLIDALMMAYIVEMISIEKVVSGVKRFSNFSASKELPFDLEDAMVFWINKVNIKMREIVEKELKMKQHLLESPSHPKSPSKWYWKLVPVRYRRDHLSGRTLQHFPLLDDLLKDVSDGTALLAVIHFYCPELIRLEDICLKEVPSIADSVYNIQLIKEFSNEYLNKCFYLKPEDLLYSPPVLKNNVMVFVAELFWWFESVKPDFVQPRDLQEIRDVRLLLQPKSSRPHVPISNVTKRSFMTSSNSADTLSTPQSPDLSTKQSSLSPSHSLLPLRQRQQNVAEESTSELRNRSNSVTCPDGLHQGSILAWPERRPERRPRPVSQPVPYALHCPLEDDADSISLARSISKDSLASNIMCITPKHMLGSGPQLSQHRLSGQSLLSHMRIEDEEEEIEEEELVAVIHPSAFSRRRLGSDMEQDELEIQSAAPTSRVAKPRCSPRFDMGPFIPDHQADSYYLEPLMPAISKPAKEKSISLNKEEESGESRFRTASAVRKAAPNLPSTSQRKELNRSTFTPIPAVESAPSSLRPPTEGSIGISQSGNKQPHGFFLHSFIPSSSGEPGCPSPFSTVVEVADSDSDIADLEEDEEDDDQMELTKDVVNRGRGKYFEDEEECEFGEAEVESVKLREDLKVSERDDKEDCSGRSSPCPSTISWASSCSASGSTSVKMTSFAERKLLKLGLRDGFSSTSSSQKTTPDGSEVAPCPPWQLRSDCTSGWMGKEPISVLGKTMAVSPSVVPSELLQLHMQLEEQRRAIEYQKKKMETLSARQRLKLGKAAFLNIVKKGGGKSDTLPLPLRHSESAELAGRSRVKIQSCKDDSCLDALKVQAKAGQTEGGQMKGDNRSQDSGAEPDLNECSHSIDLLNEAISSIQQQMMQLSFQQDLLMKRVVSPPEHVVSPPERVVSPPERVVPPPERVVPPPERVVPPPERVVPPPERVVPPPERVVSPPERVVSPPEHMVSPPERVESGQSTTPDTTQSSSSTSDSRSFAVHFVDISGSSSAPARRPPKLSSSQRRKASEQKQSRENSKMTPIKANTQSSQDTSDGDQKTGSISRKERNIQRNTTFRVRDDLNFSDKSQSEDAQVISSRSTSPSQALEQEDNVANSGKEASVGDENTRAKGQLIEVDLSELKNGSADGTAEGEQRNALGFFFKDDEKAEDEMAKRRAAFLLKQQRKAEETRLRKQQQEADVELKRDEARRKAEEDRIRKEEEKARRELIKQEYLRRKQQALMEEQGLVKPRPRTKSRRSRPKSLHREESNSLSKGSTTRNSLKVSMLFKAKGSAADSMGADLSYSHRGSTLSLATEADSVISGGAESHRAGSVCSMESFPMLSRASSRNMERDWENGSIASSITSMEYNGPKLFKEPSSKSNKPIIINAIAHCCLAGKVNEGQKNAVIEELEKCESNHLIILFRDGGCQFRGIYSYSPDTEEIAKFTGTGPRNISRKMIDKVYKYNSDRKQFTVIPAKSVSVSVDALTIHNHLWQVKRPGSARRK
ncbi:calmodulin-regulated spectrin-associated protein 1-B-like isoform X2 [Acanthopagrus latus]|uniref:calmodulin-regulated spectrin-associated protein 1-B-like isoform X2 n=1 Tax=Acanthopagrus latus TaxID=8177 RepID=UPI00187C2761|nr:calmodulin-regulated spectrin-associated protein 1-B-like isoform X2 [Acanthopagrus latus]